MLHDADIVVSWRARPRSFVALMSLYESNHVRFVQLAGDPARLCGTLSSRVNGDCELQLSVLAHHPYTSMLELTYLLPACNAGAAAAPGERLPALRVRAYHDARLLEVEGVQTARSAERELQQRWARNMMLNKWLEYCAERGHRFSSSARST
jgi:uncharacterized protein YqiB (DUF1249 family)